MSCPICHQGRQREILWLASVGAGPANLSLAAMLSEVKAELRGAHAVFHGSSTVSWHDGQLLPGTTLLSAFVWDLITPVNPRSRFSFLSYLDGQGRLAQFLNSGIVRPSRREFQDYLRWTAAEVGTVRFSHQVYNVQYCDEAGLFHVSSSSGAGPVVVDAQNVTLGVGTRPLEPFPEDNRLVVGVGKLLERVSSGDSRPDRIAVIGAGQSAAEAVDYCMDSFPNCSIEWFCPDFSPVDIDESAFAMELFLDDGISRFFERDRAGDGGIPSGLTSGVDAMLSKRIVQRQYDGIASGMPRLRLVTNTRIQSIESEAAATLISDRGARHPSFDLVVVATGRSSARDEALALLDDDTRTMVGGGPDRGYAHALGSDASSLLFIQSGNEQTHSETDRNFSTAPFRNARILARLLGIDHEALRWR